MSGKGSRSATSPTGTGTREGTVTPDGAHQNDGAATVDEAGALGYEQARDELAEVVARLEAGGLSLDESLTLWERGEHLARQCTAFLDGARERVETVLADADEAAAEH